MVKFFHSSEIALHSSADDCWVCIHGNVLDLTEFLSNNRGPLARPIIEAARKDISFWFDKETGDVKTYVDPDRNLTLPYTPMGR